MNRSRFLVATLALGGLVGAAQVRSTADEQQQRLKEFLEKAQAARVEQKLDNSRKALVAKYPTPEIAFSKPVEARGGSEVTVFVTGQFVPGSLVVVPCEGVEVLSTKVTPQRAEARVRVLPDALPYECDLQVVTPVSGISATTPVLHIQGSYEWELKLSNGMTTRWKTSMGEDGYTLAGQSEWSNKGKPLGTRAVVVRNEGDGLSAAVELTEEESGEASAAYEASSADMEAMGKQMDALMKKAQAECSKLPDEKQGECQAKYGKQIQALSESVLSKAQAASNQAQSAVSICPNLKLKAVGGRVTGTAEGCGAADEVKVTGTYKRVAAK